MTRLRPIDPAKLSLFLRYGAGSLVAMGCSELVLAGSYDFAGAGPQTAAILGWAAGALPSYVLNRRWAWRTECSGRAERGRQNVLYWFITLCTALIAVGAATGMDDCIKGSVTSRGAQSFLVGAAYLVAYGVVLVVRFVLFDRLVFADRAGRYQVPATTQA